MAELEFKIKANYEEVRRLRSEITALEAQLKKVDTRSNPAVAKGITQEIAQAKASIKALASESAQAVQGSLEKTSAALHQAKEAIIGISEKIIAQRGVVREAQNEVKRLTELYRDAVKNKSNNSDNILSSLKGAKDTLNAEKTALFHLNQEKASASIATQRLKNDMDNLKGATEQNTQGINLFGGSIKGKLAALGGVAALQQLGSEIIRVRGEFQSMETTLETLLGSKAESDKMMGEIKKFAAVSPLKMKDVMGATQTMLGFNIEAEKVPRFISAIGDVSMGDAGKFQSLSLSFSQMSAAGRLLGQDLNQMIGQGFNPLQIISEKTGKSIAVLKKDMEKGAISAEMVQQAFLDATSAGGRFYRMSEKQAETLNGQLSMMADAWDRALNEMGESSESFMMKGVQGVTAMIENYEKIGKALIGLVATYGAYAVAVKMATVAQNGMTLAEMAEIAMKKAHTAVTWGLKAANDALKASMLTNPYVLATVAIVALVAALWTLYDATTTEEKALKSLAETTKKAEDAETEYNNETKEMVRVASDASSSTQERTKAINGLIARYPDIFKKYIDEKGHLRDLIALQKELNEAQGRESLGNKKKRADRMQSDADLLREMRSLDAKGRLELYRKNKKRLDFLAKELSDADVINGSNGMVFLDKSALDKSITFKQTQATTAKRESNRAFTEDRITKFQDGISNLTSAQKKALLQELQRGQSKGNENTSFMFSGINDYITKKDAKGLITILQGSLDPSNRSATKADIDQQIKDATTQLEALTEKEANGAKGKALKAKIAKLQQRQGAYSTSSSSGGGRSSTPKVKTEGQIKAEEDRKEREEERQAQDALRKEQARRAEALALEAEEIETLEEGAEKRRRQADLALKRAKEENTKRKEAWMQEQNGAITKEQEYILKLYDEYAQKRYDKAIEAERLASEASLRTFEMAHGTYLEKRKAIVADADAKTAKAQTEGEKKTIVAETKKQLEELDFKEMQGAMDWEAVFSDLGVQATAQLEAMEQQLRSIIEANKDLSPEKMKTLVDALSNIRKEVASRNPFKAISDSLKEIGQHKRSVDTLQRSLEVYSTSIGAVYRVAEENGDALVMATEGNKEVTIEYIDAEGKAVTATMKYADALKMLKNEQKELTNSQRTLNNGINGVGSKLSEVAQIGNSFKGLADELGIKVPEGLSKAFEGMGKAGQAMESLDVTKPGSFLNINNYLDMATGVVMQLKGIGELIFGGADTKRYDEMKEKYDALIEVWDTLIDRKLEYLNQAEGQEITRTAKEAKSLVEEQMKAYRRLGNEYLNSGSGTFSSSKGKKLRKKMNSEDWADVKKVLGTTDLGGRLEKLFDLSVDKLKALQEGATSFWSKLDDQTKEYLNNVIEGEKSLQDIIDQQRESITGVSFDGFYDSFLSTLSDMDSAVSDFADDIEGYLQKAILSSWVGQTLKKRLETLYTQFALSGEDGTITKEEASVLSAEYARIAKEAVAYRNSLKETFGWGSSGSDSSSSKGFEAMSQDTATELNGRFTALQISTAGILDHLKANSNGSLLAQRMEEMKGVGTRHLDIVTQTLDIVNNSYLELQAISENTYRSALSLSQIGEDMATIKTKLRNL